MRGQIIRRGHNTFLLRVYLGEVNGKRRYMSKTVHCTKKEAEAELRNWLGQIERGSYVEPSKLTLGEWLDQWLRVKEQEGAPITSLERYEGDCRLYIKPKLGGIPIQRLNAATIEKFYLEYLEAGYAPNTVRAIHRTLNAALNHAVRRRVIPFNPAKGVTIPRQKRNIEHLTPEQARQLLAAAKDTPLYIAVLLGLHTGMRIGEILGLTWDAVDLDAGVLMVRQEAVKTRKGMVLKPPKTRTSVRSIQLGPFVVQALRAHRKAQAEQRLAAGADWQDHNLVFCGDRGQILRPDSVNKRLQRLMKAAGLPPMTTHKAFRHTAASLMLRQGIHPKIVSERLGHASVGITLDLYSHVAPDLQKAAAERLDAFLLEEEGVRTKKGR